MTPIERPRSAPRMRGRALALVVASTFVLGACGGVRDQLGLSKRSPDEFTVVSKPPLVIPPNFTLRPPAAGAVGPSAISPAADAKAALLGNAGKAGAASAAKPGAPSEVALLALAGATDADAAIREVVRRETSLLSERDKSFADALIFWQKQPPFGSVVDASKEAQRLRQTAAAGQPPTAGETPTIERRKRALLEGIF